jgi:fumarylacetoacetase
MIFGGMGNTMGKNIDINDASDNIAGYCIMNDLSARMIQRIEYVPLGPFLGKSFNTVISPWVVTPEALEIFRI